MGDVVYATFGGVPEYDEALFRQALNQEMRENGGNLTHAAVEDAYLRTVEIAAVYKEEDPVALDEFVGITLSLLERERELIGQDWSP
jgi:hypothetical protein